MTDVIDFSMQAINNAIEAAKKDQEAVFDARIIALLRRLRDTDPECYNQKRDEIAATNNVDMRAFDQLMDADPRYESQPQRKGWIFPETVPTTKPVDFRVLLSGVAEMLSRLIVAPRATLDAAALYIAFTWVHDMSTISPLAIITAPEMRAGKTTLLMAMAKLCKRSLSTGNISTPSLVRAVDKWSPTLLIDEVDSFFSQHSELRGVINTSLYRDVAYIVRCNSDNYDPQLIRTFCPKILCGIGSLPPTIEDRAIVLRLNRKLETDQLESVDATPNIVWLELRSRFARFALDAEKFIKTDKPPKIRGLDDRANDCWRPLLTIAKYAGGHWPERARAAAVELSRGREGAKSEGSELLASIRDVITEQSELIVQHPSGAYISCANLIQAIVANSDSRWHSPPLTGRKMGLMLGAYGIKSQLVRTNDKVLKCYYVDNFSDFFKRYL